MVTVINLVDDEDEDEEDTEQRAKQWIKCKPVASSSSFNKDISSFLLCCVVSHVTVQAKQG